MSNIRKKAVKAVLREAKLQEIDTIDNVARAEVVGIYSTLRKAMSQLQSLKEYDDKSSLYIVNPPQAEKYYTGALGCIHNVLREMREANRRDPLVAEMLADMEKGEL